MDAKVRLSEQKSEKGEKFFPFFFFRAQVPYFKGRIKRAKRKAK